MTFLLDGWVSVIQGVIVIIDVKKR